MIKSLKEKFVGFLPAVLGYIIDCSKVELKIEIEDDMGDENKREDKKEMLS
jgi:hypothetical protein